MKRRVLFIALLGGFLLGILIRIVHFPFRVPAVMRVIPADAVMMSRHVRPGPRLLKLLAEGGLDPLLSLAGYRGDAPGLDLAAEEGTRWLAQRLGKRYLATAYVDSFGGRPVPALIASAWVGGIFTHLARMGLLDRAFSDFRVVQPDRQTRIWRGYFPDLPAGFRQVSFGMYEGVAFGVASDDPLGAVHLDRVMRRQARSGAESLLESQADLLDGDLPDRLRLQGWALDPVLVGADLSSSTHLQVQVLLPAGHADLYGQPLPAALEDFLAMIVPSAALLVAGTARGGLQALQQGGLPPDVGRGGDLLFQHAAMRLADAGVVIWMPGWEYGGRLLRLRVPALAMAIETGPGVAAYEILGPLLQWGNARFQTAWGFAPYGKRGVLALAPPAESWYGRLAPGERAGFAVWNGYAIWHSSAEALDALLGSFGQDAARDPYSLPEETGWYGKADLVKAGEVLRMAFASYALWQSLEGRNRDRVREDLWRQGAQAMEGYAGVEAMLRVVEGGRGLGVVTLLRGKGNP